MMSKKITHTYLILCAFLFFSFIVFFNIQFVRNNPFVIATFVVNGALFLIGMVVSQYRRPFSIQSIFWIFMFFFMFYSPLIQYSHGKFPWSFFAQPTDELLLECNVICFVFSFIFMFVVNSKSKSKKNILINLASSRYTINYTSSVLLLIISLLILLIAIKNVGITGLISFRETEMSKGKFYTGDNQSLGLIINSFVPGFLTVSSFFSIDLARKNKKYAWVPILQILMLVLCCFPTSLSRNKIAAIYFSLLLVIFPFLRKKNNFFWFFIFSLFFMLPLLNYFRYESNSSFSSYTQALLKNIFVNNYLEGDYDAYRTFSLAVLYSKQFGITYGMQLLGALLFFVPRSIWPSKPIGSGAFIVQSMTESSFSNISCAFIGETFINFGYLGIIIMPIIFGFIVKTLDDNYFEIRNEEIGVSVYYILIPMIFFILRGDLMSSYAYTFGFLAVWIFILQLFSLKRSKKERRTSSTLELENRI